MIAAPIPTYQNNITYGRNYNNIMREFVLLDSLGCLLDKWCDVPLVLVFLKSEFKEAEIHSFLHKNDE